MSVGLVSPQWCLPADRRPLGCLSLHYSGGLHHLLQSASNSRLRCCRGLAESSRQAAAENLLFQCDQPRGRRGAARAENGENKISFCLTGISGGRQDKAGGGRALRLRGEVGEGGGGVAGGEHSRQVQDEEILPSQARPQLRIPRRPDHSPQCSILCMIQCTEQQQTLTVFVCPRE